MADDITAIPDPTPTPEGSELSFDPSDPVFASPAASLSPAAMRVFDDVLAAAVVVHGRGIPLSVAELCNVAPQVSESDVRAMVGLPFFREALERRGIPADSARVGLSAEQVYAIQVMTDPSVELSPVARLRRLGVSYEKWRNWLRDPLFAELYGSLAEGVVQDLVLPAIQAVGAAAARGDVSAAKLLLGVSGRWEPGRSQVSDSSRYEAVIRVLSESVQRYVKDPEVLERIGEDVKAAAVAQGVVDGLKSLG